MTTTRSGSCVRSRDKRAMTQIRRSYPIVELFSVVGLVIHDSIKKTKNKKQTRSQPSRCSATANRLGIGVEASITRPSNQILICVDYF